MLRSISGTGTFKWESKFLVFFKFKIISQSAYNLFENVDSDYGSNDESIIDSEISMDYDTLIMKKILTKIDSIFLWITDVKVKLLVYSVTV